MYTNTTNRHFAVILCAIIVISSLSAVCATQYPISSGICYIMPVYTNVHRFALYNKQTLANVSDTDIQWIKESANVYIQNWIQDMLMPSCSITSDIAQYTTVAIQKIQGFGYNIGRIYHMLN